MEINKKSFDEMQTEIKDEIAPIFRSIFTKDEYGGKIQAITVISNKVTGKIDIVSNNVNLNADAKKLLLEAYESIKRGQWITALVSTLMSKKDKEEN